MFKGHKPLGSQASVWLMATNWQMMIDSWSSQLNIDLKFRWTLTNARRFSLIGQFHILWSLIGTGKAKKHRSEACKSETGLCKRAVNEFSCPHLFSLLSPSGYLARTVHCLGPQCSWMQDKTAFQRIEYEIIAKVLTACKRFFHLLG